MWSETGPPGVTQAALRAAHERLQRGGGGRVCARLCPLQERMVERYLDTGRLAAEAGRAAGKSFVLSYLAAVELSAGKTVAYRNGLSLAGQRVGSRDFLAALEVILGPKEFNQAQGERRLHVPGFHAASGLEVDADLRDEAWVGHGFVYLRARRVAMVGSLPDDTIRGGPPANPSVVPVRDWNHLHELRTEYLARAAAESPGGDGSGDADPVILVGPNGRIEGA